MKTACALVGFVLMTFALVIHETKNPLTLDFFRSLERFDERMSAIARRQLEDMRNIEVPIFEYRDGTIVEVPIVRAAAPDGPVKHLKREMRTKASAARDGEDTHAVDGMPFEQDRRFLNGLPE